MPRVARAVRPGALYFVSSRFVDRDWFLSSEAERRHYLSLLGRALNHSDWRCVAYCVMCNEVQLAMISGAQPLETWATRVNSPFARWLNKQRGRSGPIFAERPASFEIPRERELDIIAYIHNAPVRANIVRRAADSSWSSHQAYLGRIQPPPWLAMAEALERVGCSDHPGAVDDAARASVNSAFVFATVQRLETMTEPAVAAQRRLPTVNAIVTTVARRVGIPTEMLQQPYARRGSTAKRIAIHAAAAFGLPVANIAAALNISRQRGARIAANALTPDEQTVLDEIASELTAST